MPVQIANDHPVCADGVQMSAEVRREAWEIAFSQCQCHADTMALWSDVLAVVSSANRRNRWGRIHHEIYWMAEAARKASLANELAARSLSGR